MVGFGPGLAPLAPPGPSPIPLDPTTTTTSPTPNPFPQCDPQEEIPKLTKDLAKVNEEIKDQNEKLPGIEKLPLTDERRKAFNTESTRINFDLLQIVNKALECGYQVILTPDGVFQLAPG
jgi:hypothetical protein